MCTWDEGYCHAIGDAVLLIPWSSGLWASWPEVGRGGSVVLSVRLLEHRRPKKNARQSNATPPTDPTTAPTITPVREPPPPPPPPELSFSAPVAAGVCEPEVLDAGVAVPDVDGVPDKVVKGVPDGVVMAVPGRSANITSTSAGKPNCSWQPIYNNDDDAEVDAG